MWSYWSATKEFPVLVLRTAWLDIGFVNYVVLLEIRTKGQEIPVGCDISEHERQAGRDRQWCLASRKVDSWQPPPAPWGWGGGVNNRFTYRGNNLNPPPRSPPRVLNINRYPHSHFDKYLKRVSNP